MLEIDITHNLDDMEKQLHVFANQIPFAASLMMNDTMKDVQRNLRQNTFRKAWTNRNKALPKAATVIYKRASKSNLVTELGPARGKNGFAAGEGFLGRQITGRTKTPKGSHIAIPKIGPGMKRLAGGAISKSKRPRNNAKLFKVPGRGGTELLMERQREGMVLRYTLAPKARGTDRLRRYFPDAKLTVQKVMPGHWDRRINNAITTAKRRHPSRPIR